MAKRVVFNFGSPTLIMSAMISTDKVITEISDKERLMPLASKISFKEYTPQLRTLRFGCFKPLGDLIDFIRGEDGFGVDFQVPSPWNERD